MEALVRRIRRSFSLQSALARAWRWLVRPSPRIRDASERRQSQLLATLLVLFIPMAALAMVLRPLVLGSGPLWGWPLSGVFLAGILLLVAGYILNRVGRYLVASTVVVGTQFAIIFISAVEAGSRGSLSLLAYLVVPTLFGSVFLAARLARIVTAVSILGMLALTLVAPGPRSGDLISLLMFVAIVSVLILVASAYRDRLERERQAQLVASETRYRTLIDLYKS